MHNSLLHLLLKNGGFLNTDVSQGSVATRLGCGGVFIYHFVTNFLLSTSEKNLKIGKYLVKLWTRVWCLVFFDSRCIYAYNWFTPLFIVYNIGAHSIGTDNSDCHHSQIPGGDAIIFPSPQKSVKGVTWASFDQNLSWIYGETSPVWARGRCRVSPPHFLAECCEPG